MASVTVTLDQALKAGQRNHGRAFAESWHDALHGDWLRVHPGEVSDTDVADFLGFWFAGCERLSVDTETVTVTFGFDTDDDAVHYLLRWL
ncbi:MAG TPA: hypothetical protein VGW40_02815 [Allosphingosinicella sp.]|nr:hypothetical protein [Allosphingosinicella sp.]